MDGDWKERQEGAELYLVSLDVRPESDLESFTCLQHLKAISLNHGFVQNRGRRRHLSQMFADESITKLCLGWQGKKGLGIECHFGTRTTF